MKNLWMIALLILLAACQTTEVHYSTYLAEKGLNKAQSPEAFQHCRGYGCKFVDDVSLSDEEWQPISAVFTPPAKTAEDERTKISHVISIFEQTVGAKTGTEVDIHGTFMKIGEKQLDCVDESTNTTVYLSMLEDHGFLKFHKVEPPDARWPIVHAGRWPHQTAVISETATGQRYVVDSWFFDNGHAAQIVDLETWKQGWKPEEYR